MDSRNVSSIGEQQDGEGNGEWETQKDSLVIDLKNLYGWYHYLQRHELKETKDGVFLGRELEIMNLIKL